MAAAVSADNILGDLQQLWGSLAGQPSPESQAVLRACAMTLIVFAEETEDAAVIAQTLAEVMREHPNRAVIVRVRADSGPLLDYRVTAQCWMPLGTRQQVCCEQVEITASDASLPGLMPILAAITAPDVPVVAWCRSARIFGLRSVAPPLERAGKLIVDSAVFPDARAALEQFANESARGRRVADLSWTRITRWREIVAQIFEDPARRDLVRRLRQVRILYGGEAPPATAYYLAGWMTACAECGDIDVRLESVPQADGGIEGVMLGSDSHVLSMRRGQGSAVLIEADSLRGCVVLPRLTETELLGNELAVWGRDEVFERSLTAAVRLARR